MGFNCGIVGLPNVGKSTIFNALTAAGAAAANFPFCTIEPNVGIVPVPDSRMARLAQIAGSEKILPTTLEVVDIAGLVAGASKGEGLGNKFLGHIRQVDAIAQVVRCFEDENIAHVAGKVDPIADIEVIRTELLLCDLETLDKRIIAVEKGKKTGDKKALELLPKYKILRDKMDEGVLARMVIEEGEAELYRDLFLITAKPLIFVVNVSEAELGKETPLLADVKKVAERDGAKVVSICGKIEAELAELSTEDRASFLADLGLTESGLERFIRAEVMSYDDLDRLGSEQAVKEKGLLRVEGKDYVFKDGDVAHFRFNV